MTPQGELAFELVNEAFANHSVIPGIMSKLNELTLGTDDPQARNEIGDAYKMVSRLAGSLEPAGRNISSQMREGDGGQ